VRLIDWRPTKYRDGSNSDIAGWPRYGHSAPGSRHLLALGYLS
jgi:hypothetical protein